jgi:glutathione S-transferase
MSGMSDENEKAACTMSPPTLFDKPVSNNGARCRIIIYKKGLILGQDIVIKSPDELGGLKSAEYLALNPQGKMPVLVTSHGNIPESDTIARYLLDTFAKGPSFTPSTIEARVKSDLLCRLHDMYITTVQGCLYKEAPPFGAYHSRYKALEELKRQLLIVDSNVDAAGPYLAGADLSLADATLFPTLVFVFYMLPKFVESWDAERVVGVKLLKWFEWIKNADSVFARVFEEMQQVAWTASILFPTLVFVFSNSCLRLPEFNQLRDLHYTHTHNYTYVHTGARGVGI